MRRKVQAQRKFAQGAPVPTNNGSNSDRSNEPINFTPNREEQKKIIHNNTGVNSLLDIVCFNNLHIHKKPVVLLERLSSSIANPYLCNERTPPTDNNSNRNSMRLRSHNTRNKRTEDDDQITDESHNESRKPAKHGMENDKRLSDRLKVMNKHYTKNDNNDFANHALCPNLGEVPQIHSFNSKKVTDSISEMSMDEDKPLAQYVTKKKQFSMKSRYQGHIHNKKENKIVKKTGGITLKYQMLMLNGKAALNKNIKNGKRYKVKNTRPTQVHKNTKITADSSLTKLRKRKVDENLILGNSPNSLPTPAAKKQKTKELPQTSIEYEDLDGNEQFVPITIPSDSEDLDGEEQFVPITIPSDSEDLDGEEKLVAITIPSDSEDESTPLPCSLQKYRDFISINEAPKGDIVRRCTFCDHCIRMETFIELRNFVELAYSVDFHPSDTDSDLETVNDCNPNTVKANTLSVSSSSGSKVNILQKLKTNQKRKIEPTCSFDLDIAENPSMHVLRLKYYKIERKLNTLRNLNVSFVPKFTLNNEQPIERQYAKDIVSYLNQKFTFVVNGTIKFETGNKNFVIETKQASVVIKKKPGVPRYCDDNWPDGTYILSTLGEAIPVDDVDDDKQDVTLSMTSECLSCWDNNSKTKVEPLSDRTDEIDASLESSPASTCPTNDNQLVVTELTSPRTAVVQEDENISILNTDNVVTAHDTDGNRNWGYFMEKADNDVQPSSSILLNYDSNNSNEASLEDNLSSYSDSSEQVSEQINSSRSMCEDENDGNSSSSIRLMPNNISNNSSSDIQEILFEDASTVVIPPAINTNCEINELQNPTIEIENESMEIKEENVFQHKRPTSQASIDPQSTSNINDYTQNDNLSFSWGAARRPPSTSNTNEDFMHVPPISELSKNLPIKNNIDSYNQNKDNSSCPEISSDIIIFDRTTNESAMDVNSTTNHTNNNINIESFSLFSKQVTSLPCTQNTNEGYMHEPTTSKLSKDLPSKMNADNYNQNEVNSLCSETSGDIIKFDRTTNESAMDVNSMTNHTNDNIKIETFSLFSEQVTSLPCTQNINEGYMYEPTTSKLSKDPPSKTYRDDYTQTENFSLSWDAARSSPRTQNINEDFMHAPPIGEWSKDRPSTSNTDNYNQNGDTSETSGDIIKLNRMTDESSRNPNSTYNSNDNIQIETPSFISENIRSPPPIQNIYTANELSSEPAKSLPGTQNINEGFMHEPTTSQPSNNLPSTSNTNDSIQKEYLPWNWAEASNPPGLTNVNEDFIHVPPTGESSNDNIQNEYLPWNWPPARSPPCTQNINEGVMHEPLINESSKDLQSTNNTGDGNTQNQNISLSWKADGRPPRVLNVNGFIYERPATELSLDVHSTRHEDDNIRNESLLLRSEPTRSPPRTQSTSMQTDSNEPPETTFKNNCIRIKSLPNTKNQDVSNNSFTNTDTDTNHSHTPGSTDQDQSNDARSAQFENNMTCISQPAASSNNTSQNVTCKTLNGNSPNRTDSTDCNYNPTDSTQNHLKDARNMRIGVQNFFSKTLSKRTCGSLLNADANDISNNVGTDQDVHLGREEREVINKGCAQKNMNGPESNSSSNSVVTGCSSSGNNNASAAIDSTKKITILSSEYIRLGTDNISGSSNTASKKEVIPPDCSGPSTSKGPIPVNISDYKWRPKTYADLHANARRSFLEPPVFKPTVAQFKDPVAFMDYITPLASKYGICKVVPPRIFEPTCTLDDEMTFNVMNQYVSRLFTRWGPGSREMCTIKAYLLSQNVVFRTTPRYDGMEVNLPKLYRIVQRHGGLNKVIERNRWGRVAEEIGFTNGPNPEKRLDHLYVKYLLPYDVLSPEERGQYMSRVERAWCKKYRRMMERATAPLHRENRLRGLQCTEEDECSDEDLEIEVALFDSEDCVMKGRRMNLATYKKIATNAKKALITKPNPTTSDIEEQYWRIMLLRQDHICVFCASIDTGTAGCGFTNNKDERFGNHPWNLKNLATSESNILSYLGPEVGVTVPTLHLGMVLSTSCWHRDPHGLPWMEYMHSGPTKIWYAIPDAQSDNFRKAVEFLTPTTCQNKSVWLPSDISMIPPNLLKEQNVTLSRIEQNPGEYIFVFPKSYTCSIATGYTVSESAYFASLSWLQNCMQFFMEAQVSSEPTMFSIEVLLMAIVEDLRTPLAVLQPALSAIMSLLEAELAHRVTLEDELPASTAHTAIKLQRHPPGTWNVREQKECEICRKSLYISRVCGLPKQNCNLCLEDAVGLIQQMNSVPPFQLYYYFSAEEIKHLLNVATNRLFRFT